MTLQSFYSKKKKWKVCFVNRHGFDLQKGKILFGTHEVSSFLQSFLFHYLAAKETEPEYKLPVVVLRIVHYFYVTAL